MLTKKADRTVDLAYRAITQYVVYAQLLVLVPLTGIFFSRINFNNI